MITKQLRSRIAMLAVLTALSYSTALGQETDTDPELPGNGFTQMVSGLNPANWRMPQFKMPTWDGILPTKEEKSRVITKKNSFVDEVSTTAKKSWHRTKSTLNPKRFMPAGFKQNTSTQPERKEPGFFSRLFAPYPESPEPEMDTKSVTDWLKQDPVR